jgi:hypothetical protein
MEYVILAINTLIAILIVVIIFIQLISSSMSSFNYIWTTFYNWDVIVSIE